MTSVNRGGEQRHGLLGKSLALIEALSRRQCHVRCTQLSRLFAIDLRPGGLVAR
jgi:hypothetical protein